MICSLHIAVKRYRQFPLFSSPAWTRDADLGVHPIEGICENHRLCLPNKLFEYIQAGLPVVVTDLPEMRRIVSGYWVGQVFRVGDTEDLAAKFDNMLLDGHINRLKIVLTVRPPHPALSPRFGGEGWGEGAYAGPDKYETLNKYRLASRTAAEVLSWDHEKHRLIDVYKSALRL